MCSSDLRSQALWALAQANPDAFVGGNVNRLRAGAVLKWPESNQIQSLDPVQAREAIAQQMEEFAAYRSELASLAGPTQADESAQVATGKVQPAQKDKAEKTTDQLTLSTAGADGTDQIAAQRQAQQTAERAAEIDFHFLAAGPQLADLLVVLDEEALQQEGGAGPRTIKVADEHADLELCCWNGEFVGQIGRAHV